MSPTGERSLAPPTHTHDTLCVLLLLYIPPLFPRPIFTVTLKPSSSSCLPLASSHLSFHLKGQFTVNAAERQFMILLDLCVTQRHMTHTTHVFIQHELYKRQKSCWFVLQHQFFSASCLSERCLNCIFYSVTTPWNPYVFLLMTSVYVLTSRRCCWTTDERNKVWFLNIDDLLCDFTGMFLH